MLNKLEWGVWRLRLECNVLELGTGVYEIDLESIYESSQMLDWIFQVHNKAWSNNQIVGDLISAFEDIFDPQATLCSLGRGHRIGKNFLVKRLGQPREKQ